MSDGAIAQLIRLPGEQRAALLVRLRARAGVASAVDGETPVPARRRDGTPAPAAYLQEQLLYLDLLSPGTAAYHIPFQFRLVGPLDIDALAAALAEIARRHEVLRSRLAVRGGRTVQLVADAGEGVADLPVIDLRGLPAGRREGQAARFAGEAAHAAFDLSAGPLVRTRLCRLADDDHLLLWIAHHAVADGQSLGVLVREIAALYEPLRRGGAGPLPDPAIQFGDYAQWQRDRLAGPDRERLVEFWTGRLAGLSTVELPVDRARPAMQRFAGARLTTTIPGDDAAALRALARERGVTLFMLLLAGFHLLLARWTGRSDLAIGTSVAGRGRPELEDLIGPFLNVVALRLDASGEGRLPEFLSAVREVTTSALAHQDLPFSQVVRRLGGARDPGRNPVFQVMFDLGAAAVEGTPVRLADGLTMTPRAIPLDVAQVDLAVVVEEIDAALHARFEYRTDLFDPTTIGRLRDAYRAVLRAMVDRPDATVAEIQAAGAVS